MFIRGLLIINQGIKELNIIVYNRENEVTESLVIVRQFVMIMASVDPPPAPSSSPLLLQLTTVCFF